LILAEFLRTKSSVCGRVTGVKINWRKRRTVLGRISEKSQEVIDIKVVVVKEARVTAIETY